MQLTASQRRTLSAIRRKWDLNLIILFGSRAKNRARADSDWDIAVRSSKRLSFNQLLRLAVALDGVVRGEAEVVDVRAASPLLLASIAQHGQLWFEKKRGDFAQFRVSAFNQYLDFKPAFDQHMRRVNQELRDFKL